MVHTIVAKYTSDVTNRKTGSSPLKVPLMSFSSGNYVTVNRLTPLDDGEADVSSTVVISGQLTQCSYVGIYIVHST